MLQGFVKVEAKKGISAVMSDLKTGDECLRVCVSDLLARPGSNVIPMLYFITRYVVSR